ncbi:protein retinal degeneration b [Lasius niger]|uniref:Protein retinal degeneration b n=2 Tax=Lasius TaxID=488720 RepID=A0A0J7KWY1_LASNI|nr:protein retinal degeneration b [Lasius niger]
MVRAHRQAWAWQDEWNGLTMEDIREIERQTQLALQRKMGLGESTDDELEENENRETKTTTTMTTTTTTPATPVTANASMSSPDSDVAKTLAATLGSIEKEETQSPLSFRKPSDIPIINTAASSEGEISPEDSPVDVNEIK